MNGDKFREQIKQDIKMLQDEYGKNNPLLNSDDYAFNYWVLTKLYNVDEEIVEDFITEYSDDGCDCYCFFEESKELYIIQNKFYNENNQLSESYVVKDFLYRPLNTLSENSYKSQADALRNQLKHTAMLSISPSIIKSSTNNTLASGLTLTFRF